MSVNQKAIARNIRAARKAAGLTQFEAASLLKMSELHYGRLERGERRASLNQLNAVAIFFGTSTLDLLVGAFPDDLPPTISDDEIIAFGKNMVHLGKSLPAEGRRLLYDIGYLLVGDYSL